MDGVTFGRMLLQHATCTCVLGACAGGSVRQRRAQYGRVWRQPAQLALSRHPAAGGQGRQGRQTGQVRVARIDII